MREVTARVGWSHRRCRARKITGCLRTWWFGAGRRAAPAAMDYESMDAGALLRLAEGGDVAAAVALAGRFWEGIGVRENPAEVR